MGPQVVNAQRVIHHISHSRWWIVEGRAILCHVQRKVAIPLFDPYEDIGEPFRIQLPVERRANGIRLRYMAGALDHLMRIVSRHCALVIVDAEEVDGLADLVEVGGREPRPCLAEHLLHFVGVRSAKQWIQILAIHVRVSPSGRREVVGTLRGWILRLEVDHRSDLMLSDRAIRSEGGTMRAHEVVARDRCLEVIAVPRRE